MDNSTIALNKPEVNIATAISVMTILNIPCLLILFILEANKAINYPLDFIY